MIVTVTLNAALDVTYAVARIRLGAAHRVTDVARRAGGKGINVARVLRALGADATVTGLAGGLAGAVVREDVAAAGLVDRLVPIEGESRRTLTVVGGEEPGATAFNEPGPEVAEHEWRRFGDAYAELAARAAAVVLSGSLPPGLPDDAYAELIARARDVAGAQRRALPVVLDADGAALLAGVAAGPDVVKPNADELGRATGIADPVAAARALHARTGGRHGRTAVVASLGPGGLIAVTPQGDWRARPPEVLAGNPTGAGDAAVAALVLGAVHQAPWPERLRCAVALSAAAVREPVAGDVPPGWRSAARDVRIEAL